MLHLAALLPCYTVDDLDLNRREQDAEQLLSAWSTLWHPALLAASGSLPSWHPAANPPAEPADYLVIVPDFCQVQLPENWLNDARAAGAVILEHLPDRPAMLAEALQHVPTPPEPLDADLVADFLALGYCYLQIEILTRKLRYTSSIDESAVQTATVTAAKALLSGDVATARNQLQTAFDRLHDARDYYQPVETHLLDLTLVASTTLGPALRTELTSPVSHNLMISAGVLREMAEHEPETLAALRQALADGRATIIGGEIDEAHLPLLDPDAIANALERGLAVYQQHLEHRPTVFGRRRYGLTPVLPQLLTRQGFTAAFHATLDDGRFPVANQSRIQWEGLDGSLIEALGCPPLDAGRSSSFLQLAEKLSDAMSLDTSATLVFAHWPGHASPWYADVQRIAKYGTVLGDFAPLATHIEETCYASHRVKHKPDEYRSPLLRQQIAAGAADPISRWARYYARRVKLAAAQTIAAMATLCGGEKRGDRGEGKKGQMPASAITDGLPDSVTGATAGLPGSAASAPASSLAADIHASLIGDGRMSPELDAKIEKELNASLAAFASAVAGTDSNAPRGTLVINPCSFAQQMPIPSSLATHHSPLATASVPALGFAWLDPQAAASPDRPVGRRGWLGLGKAKELPPLAEEHTLRNDFCEVHFDPHTGAIRSIFDYQSRRPRLAQQLAMRIPRIEDTAADENYTIMTADEVRVVRSDASVGEMLCRGRLMDRAGLPIAQFQQLTRVSRGSPVIELLIDLEIERHPTGNPWDSYYAARFAWKDEMATLYGSANLANLPTDQQQIESPYFLDLRQKKQRTTLLCGGLPFHRRIGYRKLDTLLIVPGETARSFRLGIAIDAPHPVAAAIGFLSPACVVSNAPSPPAATGWLFHLDSRNVLATHWELADNHSGNITNSRGLTAPGPAAAFRVRLLETDGQGVLASLRCFRNVSSARKINPPGELPLELTVTGDRVSIPIGPHQLAEIEVILN